MWGKNEHLDHVIGGRKKGSNLTSALFERCIGIIAFALQGYFDTYGMMPLSCLLRSVSALFNEQRGRVLSSCELYTTMISYEHQ